MTRALAYDITRLMSRLTSTTPNGIDRLDFGFARHMLALDKPDNKGLMLSFLGPRIFGAEPCRDIAEGIARLWGEEASPPGEKAWDKLRHWLLNEPYAAAPPTLSRRVSDGREGRVSGTAAWLWRYGFPLGASPARTLPERAIYLNVSQFPLEYPIYFRWLEKRPDVKPVFFLHDLLPLEFPEYFRPGEDDIHARKLATVVRYASAVIVTTPTVRDALLRHLAEQHGGAANKWEPFPILVNPFPPSHMFYEPAEYDQPLANARYFLMCGTVEPRKNHLLMLQLWREMIAELGEKAPRLIIVGKRGWENENVIDLLERSVSLKSHVLEINGLTTPRLKHLMDHACALLMPSFGEGYGLPLVEALAGNTPVIASDIPVFRHTAGEKATYRDPTDGPGWKQAILAHAVQPRVHILPRQEKERIAASHRSEVAWTAYFSAIDDFLEQL